MNTSDKKRTAERTAAAPDDDDAETDDDAGMLAAQAPATTPAPASDPADAGTATAADATPPVPAGSFGAGTELETTTDLNLREGPGVDFAIIVAIPGATIVKVQTTSGADGWVHLDYQGNLGYSSKSFLKVP